MQLSTKIPLNLLELMRDELGPFLRDGFGDFSFRELTSSSRQEQVADRVIKILIRDSRHRRVAVLLCSVATSPNLVARGMEKARQAKRALGPELGCVVVEPILEGFLGGVSYSIIPYHKPLSDIRLLWLIQRSQIRPVVLQWLFLATKKTARPLKGEELNLNFIEPLRHLEKMNEISTAARHGACETLARIQSGKWSPTHVLMHNDFWKGNILRAENYFGFVVIDWPGAKTDGYGIFDLLRLAESMKMNDAQLRAEIIRQCSSLSCDLVDARSHLMSALGELSTRLEHFPVPRFAEMGDQCLRRLKRLKLKLL